MRFHIANLTLHNYVDFDPVEFQWCSYAWVQCEALG
jgi:hypothetical protein